MDTGEVGIQPGDVLAGKYRVERVLGAGGMGMVVAAHHIQLDEKVALKFLLPQAAGSPDAIARFVREARAAVKIKSEHVARVTDVGELANGSPYMVMEYLEGDDLAAWLQKRGAMRADQAVDFVLQACEALADAHTLGIVHRDLKPANLFCIRRTDGQLSIKVLDFGISKVTTPGAPGHDLTRTSTLMGSPFYMSPEHMKLTKGVDARTDIWSLGVILFELLTGQRPFTAEGVTELAIKVATEPAPDLRDLRSDAPPGLQEVVAKCLEKDVGKRFQNVGELAVALRDFGPRDARISVERVLGTLGKGGGSPSTLVITGDARQDAGGAGSDRTLIHPTPQTAASWGQTGATTRSRVRTTLGMVVALALGVVALGSALFWYGRHGTLATPSTSGASSILTVDPGAAARGPAASPAPPPVPPPAAASVQATPTPAPAVSHAPKPARPTGRPLPGPPGAAPRSSANEAPKPAPNCDPPYTTDAQGIQHPKAECL